DGYDSADKLLARDDIDGVVLAVPNQLHAPLTVQALRQGKHVLVEKPMSRNVAEAEQMIEARDESGRVLMVGMNQRFNPAHQLIKNAMDEGAIGNFQYGRTSWTQDAPHEGLWGRGDWFLSDSLAGGGPMIDLGIHRLDLALYFLGFPEIKSVLGLCNSGIGREEAKKRGKKYDIEDSAFGLIRFENGSCLEVEASYFLNTDSPGQDTVLYGVDGMVRTSAEFPLQTRGPEGLRPLSVEAEANHATSCVEHFVRVLQGKDELIPTPEQGLEGMRIIESIYQSARTGEPVCFS
ncbi:MAG: Gfo/Idh/MocA family oxidoreductase, partial [Planctomycetes bacterium]|nr:Gfo/Idh/MocA family oxidoreductase [Planctomycetota bacterium]